MSESETTESGGVVETIIRKGVIQQLVDQTRTIANETVLRIGSDGIQTRAVDPANVAMLDVSLGAAAFESVPGGSFAAGVNLERLDDYLSRAGADDPVSFAFDPETRRMVLRHTNREFNVGLIDPDSMRNEPDIPDGLELDSTVVMPTDEFIPAIEDAEMVGTGGRNGAAIYFDVDADAGEFTIYGEGDVDDVEVTFGPDDLGDGSAFGESYQSLYSSAYLVGDSGLLGAVPKGVDLRAEFGEEFPLKMFYDFPDAEDCDAELMLAPRIDSS